MTSSTRCILHCSFRGPTIYERSEVGVKQKREVACAIRKQKFASTQVYSASLNLRNELEEK